MLDTAGKILERIIHNRLYNQYGFRKGRSTLHAVSLVVDTAKRALVGSRWKRGAKQYCLVAALNVKNAFNSARWDCIWNGLNSMEVPKYLKKIVMSYLSDRFLQYDTEAGPQTYKVTGGVPQGSVLGPLLWNVMYNGLSKLAQLDGVKLVAFADDVAVVITAKYPEEIEVIFHDTYARIHGWMTSVGFTLAEHKSTGRSWLQCTDGAL